MDQNTFKSHPVFTNYEASSDGRVRNKRLMNDLGHVNNKGYKIFNAYDNGKLKTFLLHRFSYECHNGLISKGLVVDHINRDKLDNRIENLRVVTPRENCMNSNPINKFQQRRPVIGVMVDYDFLREEEMSFRSIYSASQYYNICAKSIKDVADGITHSAYSKKFNSPVYFTYYN